LIILPINIIINIPLRLILFNFISIKL